MISFLIAIGLINIITIIHEFGHYVFARLSGVGVEIFSVGMGKELIEYVDSRGTKWRLCIFPIGGYIQPKESKKVNIHDDNVQDEKKNHRIEVLGNDFREAGLINGTLIAAAGPLFNFLSAFLCLIFIANYFGMPTFTNKIELVEANSVAYNNGLRSDDLIIAIDNKEIKNRFDLVFINNKACFLIEKNGMRRKILIDKQDKKTLGFILKTDFKKVTFIESIVMSIEMIWEIIYFTMSSILHSLYALKIQGIIGIVKQAAKAQERSIVALFLFAINLSIAIGVFNLLPIPALDGGRILIFIISAILGRGINKKTENFLNYFSIAIVGVIFIITFVLDMQGLFK